MPLARATRKFPRLTLECGELVLRAPVEADIPAVLSACSDPTTQQWLALPDPYTDAEAREYVVSHESLRQSGAGVRCAVALAADDALVAMVSLKQTDWRSQVTDIGYWAVPEHRGRGYVTRAVRELSLWALAVGMERVELHAAPDNLASNAVAQHAGFIFEGRKRNAGFIPSGRVDLNLYALTSADAP